MTAIEMLNLQTKFAKEYVKDAQKSLSRNVHMNELRSDEEVNQKHIDAILVDFINFVAMKHCIDYGLYTADLKIDSEE